MESAEQDRKIYASFEHVYLHYVGQDQEAFIKFAEAELLPEVS